MEEHKQIHTLVLDAGPLIKNVPSVSSLIASSTTLLTHPAVIPEIRDTNTRARLETTLRPFLSLREPKAESIKFIQDFARRSGDLEVLSRPDILLLALTYEVECERNGGDWRLRMVPGQKGLNGKPPQRHAGEETLDGQECASESQEQEAGEAGADRDERVDDQQEETTASGRDLKDPWGTGKIVDQAADKSTSDMLSETLQNTQISTPPAPATTTVESAPASLPTPPPSPPTAEPAAEDAPSSASDNDNDGEWITPSNLKRRQDRDQNPSQSSPPQQPTTLQSALLTTDHAMKNVALLLNLNLMSTSLIRMKQLRTTTQRCHACFYVMRPSDKTANGASGSASSAHVAKHFCPRCGLPTLNRVTCSTSSSTGAFTVHLKANMQWNNRGTRYSMPKPSTGASNGRVKGGGKNGWGNELLLAEDQKEYQRAVKDGEKERRRQDRLADMGMDGLFEAGKGGRGGGRIKVGAGRDVNGRKR